MSPPLTLRSKKNCHRVGAALTRDSGYLLPFAFLKSTFLHPACIGNFQKKKKKCTCEFVGVWQLPEGTFVQRSEPTAGFFSSIGAR